MHHSHHSCAMISGGAIAFQLPVRWMAFETLTVGKSSMMSDVWSFGVFIWELYTLAKIPYNELEGGRDIVEYLDANKRLAKPDGCPDPLYALMMSCWDGVPRQRPTFQQLKPQLEQMAVLSCL